MIDSDALFSEIERVNAALFQNELTRKKRAVAQSLTNVQASVCAAVASSYMAGAILVDDQELAAQMVDKGLSWQLRALVARGGEK